MNNGMIIGAMSGRHFSNVRATAVGCAVILATVVALAGAASAATRQTMGPYNYGSYPDAINALNSLPTLQQRVGTRYWSGDPADPQTVFCKDASQNYHCPVSRAQGQVYLDSASNAFIDGGGLWARTTASFGISTSHYNQSFHVVGASQTFDRDPSTTRSDIRTWQVQAGLDHAIIDNDAGKLIAGVNLTYGRAWAVSDTTAILSRSFYSSYFGKTRVSTEGVGVGGSLTWYGQNGFYADAQGQATWYNSDMKVSNYQVAPTYRDYNLPFDVRDSKAFGYSLGLEVGQRFEIASGLFLTPQAQVVYSRTSFDDYKLDEDIGLGIPLPGKFATSDYESVISRVGLGVEKQWSWKNANGSVSRLSLNGIGNLYYIAENAPKVTLTQDYFGFLTTVSTLTRKRQNAVWGGVGVGATYNWGSHYSVYGSVNYDTSFKNAGDNYKVSGSAGLRINW
jgi:outer membrane autotransporter protein